MSVGSTITNINTWMRDNNIFITDFDPAESKIYIAILKDDKTEEEILSLARETKVMLTMARLSVGTDASKFGVKYKAITADQILQVREEGTRAVKRLEKMLANGEIGIIK